jgi:competence ComEA-like helix-hairpin-helix protein
VHPKQKLPEWLSELEPTAEAVEGAPEAEAEEVEEVPEWLSELEPTAEAVEGAPEAEAEEAEEVPEWLSELEPTAEAVEGAPEAEAEEELLPSAEMDQGDMDAAMAWLEALAAKQGAAEEELFTKPEDRTEAVPDWLQEVEAPTEEPEPAAPTPAADSLEEVPTWMDELEAEIEAGTAGEAEVEAEMIEGEPSEEIPDWLDEVEAEIEAEAEAAVASVPEAGEPVTPEAAAVPGTMDMDDMDEAMAWLEALAAKQGVSDEELITAPEDRREETPEWLLEEEAVEGLEAPEAAAKPEIEAQEWVSEPEAEVEAETLEAEAVAEGLEAPEAATEPEIEAAELISEPEAQVEAETLEAEAVAEGLEAPEAATEPEIEAQEWVSELEEEAEMIAEPEGELFEPEAQAALEAEQPEPAFTSEQVAEDLGDTQPVRVRLDEQPAEPEAAEAEGGTAEVITPEIAPLEEAEEEVVEPITAEQPLEGEPELPEWLLETEEEEQVGEEIPWAPPDLEEVLSQPPQPLPGIEPVDVNTASLVELEHLPGVGFRTAQSIVDYREAKGSIKELSDLLQASGIDQERLSEIMPYLKIVEAEEETAIEGLLTSIPDDAQGERLSLARNAMVVGELSESLGHYQELINEEALLPELIRDLQDALYRFPMEISIWQALGDAYLRNNQTQEALDAYIRAEEILG